MPHHHATRLDLVNVADFPALEERRDRLVRCTVEITSRQVTQVPGQRQWRATYVAQILTACPA